MAGRAQAPGRCPPRPGAGPEPDRGAVTVEAALALCSLAVFLAVAIGAIAAVSASVRCIDAARELVRLAARGEPGRGREIAERLAPPGARIELVQRGDEVTAEVTAPAVPPLPLRVGGRAVAVVEPGGTTS